MLVFFFKIEKILDIRKNVKYFRLVLVLLLVDGEIWEFYVIEIIRWKNMILDYIMIRNM